MRNYLKNYESEIEEKFKVDLIEEHEVIRPAIERVHCFSMKSTNFSITDESFEQSDSFI